MLCYALARQPSKVKDLIPTVFPRLERARSNWLQEVLYSRAHCDRGRVVLNSNPPLSVNSVVVFPSNLTPRAPQHNIQFTSPQTLLHFTSFFAALAAHVHKSTNSYSNVYNVLKWSIKKKLWDRRPQTQRHPTKVGGSPKGGLCPSKNRNTRSYLWDPASPGSVIFLTH